MYCSSFLQRSHSSISTLSSRALIGSDDAEKVADAAILSWEVDEEKWRRKRRRQHRLIKKMGAAWGGGTVNLSRPRCVQLTYIYIRKLQANIAIDAHCFGTCLLQCKRRSLLMHTASVHVCCRKCVVQDCKSETCDC